MGLTILNELSNAALVHRLKGLDSYAVKNAFFANFLTGVLMLKLQDLKGLALINDRSNMKLAKFTNGMTDITFWGRALFFSSDPVIQAALQPGHAKLLTHEAGFILDSRIHKLISTVMQAPDAIDWQELVASLIILKHRFELQSSYFDKIVSSFNKWDSLSSSAKKSVISNAFMYLTQSDPHSALLGRVRALSGSSMLGDVKALAKKLISYKTLVEDEGDSISTSDIATSSSTSSNAIITRFGPDNHLAGVLATNVVTPSNDKKKKFNKIKKRQRTFKLIKFKKPTNATESTSNDD